MWLFIPCFVNKGIIARFSHILIYLLKLRYVIKDSLKRDFVNLLDNFKSFSFCHKRITVLYALAKCFFKNTCMCIAGISLRST